MSNTFGSLAPYKADPTGLVSVRLDPLWIGTTKGRITNPSDSRYLSDMLVIPFADVMNGISEQSSASYATVGILGRQEDIQVYTGATNRLVPMTFQFMLQGNSGGVVFEDASVREVIDPAKWLDSLKYAVPSNNVTYPPPTVILAVGDLLWMRAIVKSCTIRWNGPFSPNNMYPSSATVECAFMSVSTNPNGYTGTNTSIHSRFNDSTVNMEPSRLGTASGVNSSSQFGTGDE